MVEDERFQLTEVQCLLVSTMMKVKMQEEQETVEHTGLESEMG